MADLQKAQKLNYSWSAMHKVLSVDKFSKYTC